MRHHAPLIDLEDAAEEAAELLRLLANPHRLQVLCALRTGELSVGEIAARVGLSHSALSQHLAKLRADQVVGTRRQGQAIFYRVVDDEVLSVLAVVADSIRRRRGRR
ncbi:MAG TPA: metalloregulator ArsR/SmtB family transcription factor [Phenylobacterium sp.]